MNQNMQDPTVQAESLRHMGRGPDTQLIHMTDSEVDALDGLSGLVFNEPLRTNPETGLPEAGIFKQLLPTILAIGAGAFLGPGAASLFGAKGLGLGTALAQGLGTGLTSFFGHVAGQGLSGQDLDFGRAALAGAGSGLTAGFGAAGDATTGLEDLANRDPDIFDLNIGSTGAAEAQTPVADALQSMAQGSGPGGIRTFSEGFDYLTADPWKRVALPLGVAAAAGEFDEPYPEAPADFEKDPFIPTKLRATREKRELPLTSEGEVDIAALVGPLPEGQSSRFFTPTVFEEEEEVTEDEEVLKQGGLVGLQTGGEIAQAIGALTGGQGASVLPLIAESVEKEEEEEEERIQKPITLGIPRQGVGIGGGQPVQPFQSGGQVASNRVRFGKTSYADLNEGAGGITVANLNVSPFDVALEIPGAVADKFAGIGKDPGPALVGSGITTGIGKLASAPGLGFGILGVEILGKALNSALGKQEQEEVQNLEDLANRDPNIFDPQNTNTGIGLPSLPSAPALPGPALFSEGIGEEVDPGIGPSLAAIADITAMADTEAANQAADDAAQAAAAAANIQATDFSGFGPVADIATAIGAATAAAPQGGDFFGDTLSPNDNGSGGSTPGDGDVAAAKAAQAAAAASDFGDGPLFEHGGYLGGIAALAQGGNIPYFEGRVPADPRGSGDGMSDNIPFIIAGKEEGGPLRTQPAVLSPDEYVFPADVVAMLGNGSSTAGANELDQFVNNFRMDKYGRPKQPPEMRGGLRSLA